MTTHIEENLQRAIDRIRDKVLEMSKLDRRALMDCLQSIEGRNRQLAYLVILRDRHIDALEKEIDRLCLEFLARQQPVAQHLRFAYATIKINLELERIGDYAESIARQTLKLISRDVEIPVQRIAEIAHLAVPMLDAAIRAFVTQDAILARTTMEIEEAVDVLRSRINAELFQLREQNRIPLEAFNPLLTIARRFERVSDQAKNICEETIYMCTGEYAKHDFLKPQHLLFVDTDGGSRSLMAEAIGASLKQTEIVFMGAGLQAGASDPGTLSFLRSKGMDVSNLKSRPLSEVPNLSQYRIAAALDSEVQKVLPQSLGRAVCLDWSIRDPSTVQGAPSEIRAAHETTFQYLQAQIRDLVEAVHGDKTE